MNTQTDHPPPSGAWLTGIVFAAIWLLLWLLLSEWNLSSLSVGIPTVALATWGSLRLKDRGNVSTARPSISLTRLPRFALFFLWESILGGWDVARRALGSEPHLNPGFLRIEPRLQTPGARLFFVNCVSLMPGTLTARLDGNELLIHSLDIHADHVEALEQLEREVGLLFRDSGVEAQ